MSSSSPAAKRARLGEAKTPPSVGTADRTKSGDQEAADKTPSLTVDLWVASVDYLDFDETMKICAVSRLFLKEVVPRIKEINVDGDKRHCFPAFANRLSGVRILIVSGFFEADSDGAVEFNQSFMMKLLTFLAKLPMVETIFLYGWKQEEGERKWSEIKLFQHERAKLTRSFLSDRESEKLRAFVYAVCELNLSRSLVRTVDIPWLLDHSICPRAYDEYDRNCEYCRTLCSAFRFREILGSLAGRCIHIHEDFFQEHTICLEPRQALEILRGRHDNIGGAFVGFINKPLLLDAIQNEKLHFIQALIELSLLPKVNRDDIDAKNESNSKKDIVKPRIYKEFYDLLVSKGCPLRTSDFSKIFSEQDDFDERDDRSSGSSESDDSAT